MSASEAEFIDPGLLDSMNRLSFQTAFYTGHTPRSKGSTGFIPGSHRLLSEAKINSINLYATHMHCLLRIVIFDWDYLPESGSLINQLISLNTHRSSGSPQKRTTNVHSYSQHWKNVLQDRFPIGRGLFVFIYAIYSSLSGFIQIG